MDHIWCCTCGHEQSVEREAFELGYVYECPNCTQVWGCIRPRRGSKAWVKIAPGDVRFHRLLEEPKDDDE